MKHKTSVLIAISIKILITLLEVQYLVLTPLLAMETFLHSYWPWNILQFLLGSLPLARSQTYLFLHTSHLVPCVRPQGWQRHWQCPSSPAHFAGHLWQLQTLSVRWNVQRHGPVEGHPWRYHPLLQHQKEQPHQNAWSCYPVGLFCSSGHNTAEANAIWQE